MDTLLPDLRFAFRTLRRQPAFTAVAVLTLGLGIGATTAIFNAAEVTLHRPLPFANEKRLVRIYRVPAAGTPRISLRPRTYQVVEENGRFFDRIVAQRYTSFVYATDAGPEPIVGIAVTAGWTRTLGVHPLLGRAFTPDEERLGAASGVVLLSYGTWQRRFGGDRGILGKQIVLNGRPYTVVGVMQRRLRYPYGAELWVPFRADDEQIGPWSLNVLALLKPGTTVAAARQELRALARNAAETGVAPALQAEGTTLTAVPLRETLVGQEGRTTLALLSAVAFLLLIVCANLANLLLAKGLNREREFAVRASIGASRGRLIRQLLTENLLLGGIGSGVGIALAVLAAGLAQPLLPGGLGSVQATVTMNHTVVAFAVGLALSCTVLFGLLPALRLSRVWPGARLGARATTGDGSIRRLGRSLVVAQVALGIVLLTGTGLIVQNLRRLATVDLGYDPGGLLIFSVSLSRPPYTGVPARLNLVSRALARLRAEPGVAAAAVTSMFPSDRANAVAQIELEGRPATPGVQTLVNHRLVSPGYFQTMGIRLLTGRVFNDRDRADAPPVVVVSRAAARRFWPGEDPIGKRVRRNEPGAPWLTIVGVVGDVRQFWGVDETWYLPYAQHATDRDASSTTFVVRSAGGRLSPSSIRSALATIAPEQPVVDLITARQLHAESLTRQRQAAFLGAGFGGFGLLLTALGLYGSVSYAVNRRRREFAIRMALGSERSRILYNVVGESVRLVALGIGLGTLGALAVTRLLAHQLEAVTGWFDPLSFAVAVLVLAATAVGAAAVPARRAARLDPMAALRRE